MVAYIWKHDLILVRCHVAHPPECFCHHCYNLAPHKLMLESLIITNETLAAAEERLAALRGRL